MDIPHPQKSVVQSGISFNFDRKLEFRRNMIDKISSEWKKLKDMFYWLHILGRHPKLNHKYMELRLLEELLLPKINSKDRQRAKEHFEQISTLCMKM